MSYKTPSNAGAGAGASLVSKDSGVRIMATLLGSKERSREFHSDEMMW
jgi:hypothetical protein